MSQVVCTAISFTAEEEPDMGDLEYIQTKVQSGDYFQVSGDINALNDTIEYTVPTARTAYMIEASIVMTTNPSASSSVGGATASKDQVAASFKVDGTTKDKAHIGMATAANGSAPNDNGSGSGMGLESKCKFNVLGLSLDGDDIKKIEIENVLDDGSAFATMSGYLV